VSQNNLQTLNKLKILPVLDVIIF